MCAYNWHVTSVVTASKVHRVAAGDCYITNVTTKFLTTMIPEV